ncbi:DUF2948 family protein [Limibaculum sp. M0105]|uniref:DUF2948 family protein n=1 Tax=Thermohalobaculum xanthum TaxID=2753746 RepID=A0A8J7M8Q1_9RHOB|nr:DUF2948 family protein [Thermohalobaculum xanthum]MBK0399825.1 DUF2948 family protein [Thermohalobaculum xanthum]
MTDDARFEDAPLSDRPLRLRAETADDLQIVSALVQDAVGKVGDVAWLPKKRRLVVLMNRFRWEDAARARGARRPFERVRTALTLDGVMAVKARGISPADREAVYALLALDFEPGEDCSGRIVARLAGGAELAAEVECLDASLEDLTRPWQAVAAGAPDHDR